MAETEQHTNPLERSPRWVMGVCLILLMATFLNYANRSALTQNAMRIQQEFPATEEQYGELAGQFSLGFAIGGLVFGVLADWVSVRILYPVVVVVWSLAGISAGFVGTLFWLGISQFVLGLFEAGHWPCSLRTTQRVFLPHERTWANSILQSGASLGAVATPLLVLALYRWDPAEWRLVFFIVGGLGFPWVIGWLLTIREEDIRRPVIQTDEQSAGVGENRELVEVPFYRIFLTRRWWLLLVVVVCINTLWHYIRIWMPVMLEKDHRYSNEFVQGFTSLYFLATFFGSLAAGTMVVRLAARGWNVHRARLATFLLFGALSTLSIPAAFLPRGNLMLALLLLVAFGSLGLFPIYYSLNQELSARNQGKVGGTLSFTSWSLMALIQPMIGRWVDHDPTVRPWIFAAVGLGPLIAFLALFFFWGTREMQDDER